MGLFGKKKKKNIDEKITVECNHKWKDFPMYLDWRIVPNSNDYYNNHRLFINVKEPYVCILCKKRKDVNIFTGEGTYASRKEAMKELCVFCEEHPYVEKDNVLIEDAIQDFIMVDREYNAIWETLQK